MSEWIHKKQQWQCYYSQLPEFTIEGPEEFQTETTEVQKVLLLEVRGILQKQSERETVTGHTVSLLSSTHLVSTVQQYSKSNVAISANGHKWADWPTINNLKYHSITIVKVKVRKEKKKPYRNKLDLQKKCGILFKSYIHKTRVQPLSQASGMLNGYISSWTSLFAATERMCLLVLRLISWCSRLVFFHFSP